MGKKIKLKKKIMLLFFLVLNGIGSSTFMIVLLSAYNKMLSNLKIDTD